MDNIRQEDEQRQKTIRENENKIARLEQKIAETVLGEEPDREEMVRSRHAHVLTMQGRLNREKNQLRDELAGIQTEQRDADSARNQARSEIERTQAQIVQLESVRNMRSVALSRERGGQDVLKAVQWIHSNQHRFRGRVYDPIQLSVGCRDPAFASQLEACVNQATMRVRRTQSIELIGQTILCEHDDDYRTLSRELSGQFRINVATLTHLHALDKHPPPFDRDTVCLVLSKATLSIAAPQSRLPMFRARPGRRSGRRQGLLVQGFQPASHRA